MVIVLAELAEQLREKNLNLGLSWTPRDQNEEADDLTNEKFGRFSPSLRIKVNLETISWKILPEMLAVSEDLYKRAQEEKSKPTEGEGRRKKKEKTLKEKQPW